METHAGPSRLKGQQISINWVPHGPDGSYVDTIPMVIIELVGPTYMHNGY